MAGIVAALRAHARIGLDTPAFIYHIEGSSRFARAAAAVFDELAAGGFEAVTSVLTLTELTVRPLQLARPEVADDYELLVTSFPHLSVVSLDRPSARLAAELRAGYRLRTPDALQIAAALQHGATAFVTNDRDLRRVVELQVVVLDDFV